MAVVDVDSSVQVVSIGLLEGAAGEDTYGEDKTGEVAEVVVALVEATVRVEAAVLVTLETVGL